MRTVKNLTIGLGLIVILAACDSGGGTSGGGTSGGSGSVSREMLSICGQGAGTYKQPDSGVFIVKSNCDFTYNGPDGMAAGRYTEITDQRISLEARAITGPNAGQCIAGTAKHKNGQIYDIKMGLVDC